MGGTDDDQERQQDEGARPGDTRGAVTHPLAPESLEMDSLPVPPLEALVDVGEHDRVFASLFETSAEPRKLGRYIVLCTLGKGGMGTVLKAYDQSLDRQVAIKVLMHPNEKPDHLLERFEREARIIARLQHPNIVQIYDYGIAHDDTPYIVMELLGGEDLSQPLQRARSMPLRAVVPLIVQAARGLHAAHAAGVVHRDLKPANLFLSRQGGEQVLKILDFGIATAQHAEPASSGRRPVLIGTPSYMSPEQVRGEAVDHRTDLWSLAIVAYQALTGTSPFAERSIPQTVTRVVNDVPAPPSRLVASLGPAVDAFFERALAKDPDQRFSSALELAAAFSALERPAEQRSAVILVVDDEPEVEMLMRQKFRRQVRRGEYELLFARDGQAALDQLVLRPDTDVVLTDLNMPGMDGLTLLGRLGRAGPALRAVVLSAYGDMSNIRQAMNAGAYDFLTKPLDFSDLEATLRKAVGDARELRQALRSIEENDALRLFVDDALLDRLLPLLRISGAVSAETLDATVVSIDVCGMRRRVEQGPASAVFEALNHSFDVVVPIVNTWHGIVVSFVGDAALVVFHGEDHLLEACSACVAVRAALSEASGEASGASSPGVCIGLDSGPVVSGNVGSRTIKRLNYTVLGDVVSRALALERLAHRGQILVRPEVAARLASHFECQPIEAPPDHDLRALYNVELGRLGGEDEPSHRSTEPVTDTVGGGDEPESAAPEAGQAEPVGSEMVKVV